MRLEGEGGTLRGEVDHWNTWAMRISRVGNTAILWAKVRGEGGVSIPYPRDTDVSRGAT